MDVNEPDLDGERRSQMGKSRRGYLDRERWVEREQYLGNDEGEEHVNGNVDGLAG